MDRMVRIRVEDFKSQISPPIFPLLYILSIPVNFIVGLKAA
jgi:hypothetical protein